jgi:hypothetical protein
MKRDMKLQNSFMHVKTDMASLYGYIKEMHNRVSELEENNLRLVSAMTVMGEVMMASQRRQLAAKKSTAARLSSKKRIVASKTRSKVHVASCAFAKNIKAFKKVDFATIAAAKKVGYKACKCLK